MKLRMVSAEIYTEIVTETWLDNNIPDAAVELAGRSLLQADRTAVSEKHRGGAVYISQLRANAKLAISSGGAVYCMISLQMNNNPEAAVIVAGDFNHEDEEVTCGQSSQHLVSPAHLPLIRPIKPPPPGNKSRLLHPLPARLSVCHPRTTLPHSLPCSRLLVLLPDLPPQTLNLPAPALPSRTASDSQLARSTALLTARTASDSQPARSGAAARIATDCQPAFVSALPPASDRLRLSDLPAPALPPALASDSQPACPALLPTSPQLPVLRPPGAPGRPRT
ncbi:hypothetical protein L3Q82_006283 [Scortum barcoo]|uniref:Uncharacterized protein n=1 Tax=Scortum barcoo TaxID=214431 RepID=A0ACB8X346_9TELE|nr:hypothetical protein L3Q82_006283 [Scortum barcoo]